MKRISILLIFLIQLPGIKDLSAQKITGVGPIRITVSEMDRSLEFYTKVLTFRKVSEVEVYGHEYENLQGVFGIRMKIATLQLGDEQIHLVDYLTAGGRSIPEDARSNDLFFQHIAIVVSDMDKAYSHLRKFNVEHVSTGPQTLPKSIPAAEGIKAFYFHDPDDHNLELIFFPKGKGDPKWQTKNENIFIGIDHTAIGVSNTDNSLKLYRDILGLERKGDSWNKGTEQEHLNNVKGAHLHITGLRSSRGPGMEFLEYLVPGPGQPYPSDTRADDIWFWQTILWTDNAEKMYDMLKKNNVAFISHELVHLPDQQLGFKKAFVIKDADGHALMIAENRPNP